MAGCQKQKIKELLNLEVSLHHLRVRCNAQPGGMWFMVGAWISEPCSAKRLLRCSSMPTEGLEPAFKPQTVTHEHWFKQRARGKRTSNRKFLLVKWAPLWIHHFYSTAGCWNSALTVIQTGRDATLCEKPWMWAQLNAFRGENDTFIDQNSTVVSHKTKNKWAERWKFLIAFRFMSHFKRSAPVKKVFFLCFRPPECPTWTGLSSTKAKRLLMFSVLRFPRYKATVTPQQTSLCSSRTVSWFLWANQQHQLQKDANYSQHFDARRWFVCTSDAPISRVSRWREQTSSPAVRSWRWAPASFLLWHSAHIFINSHICLAGDGTLKARTGTTFSLLYINSKCEQRL